MVEREKMIADMIDQAESEDDSLDEDSESVSSEMSEASSKNHLPFFGNGAS